jgi:hypothetical protein
MVPGAYSQGEVAILARSYIALPGQKKFTSFSPIANKPNPQIAIA